MRKLIAKKPIQYGGRMYEPGAALPAHDQIMAKAWIKAGTAEMQETATEPAVAEEKATTYHAAAQVYNCIVALGAKAVNAANEFIGAEALTEQLRTIFVSDELTEEAKAVIILDELGVSALDDNGQFVGAQALAEQLQTVFAPSSSQETVIAQLDAEGLEKGMSREALDKLAADLSLDASKCNNKGDVAELIAATPIQIVVAGNNGGA